MANEITNTEADALIPEVWVKEALLARYAKSVLYGRVLHKDDAVRQMGDIIHIPTMPTVSTNAVTSVGGVTNQALTPTDSTITVNEWREVTIDVVDRANIQSHSDLMSLFTPAFGSAVGVYQDDTMFDDHASFTGVGNATSGVVFNDDLILAAMQALQDNDVPDEDLSWYIPPVAIKQLLKNDKFVLALNRGDGKGLQVVGPKALGELYGIPLYRSSRVVTSGEMRKGLLLHKEAIGAATQKNFRIETLARVRKSTPISGDILFGEAVLRASHGRTLNIDADG